MMQPVTGKELEYVVDSMSNEDLLMKQCAVAAVSATNPALRAMCASMQQVHEQHYQALVSKLEQHQQMAPTQPQH
ncbi:hypothetical protein IDH44_24945 [Paenibacillus sp. IB182496]|uniref:Spore coat protein n=1 Tax=Paenibacillus sabuli TaxID=2772509 RepID=A0A927BX07_9BACL|nr:hypothetical protein [Paenibacillus sabuli]MBD2848443.1 hypothetical protein [Paenibacillus sabuli]